MFESDGIMIYKANNKNIKLINMDPDQQLLEISSVGEGGCKYTDKFFSCIFVLEESLRHLLC